MTFYCLLSLLLNRPLTVLLKFSYCTSYWPLLSSNCPLKVLLLVCFCSLTVLLLFSYCSLTVLLLSSYCPLTVLLLLFFSSSFCPLTFLSLSSCFLLTILLQFSYGSLTILPTWEKGLSEKALPMALPMSLKPGSCSFVPLTTKYKYLGRERTKNIISFRLFFSLTSFFYQYQYLWFLDFENTEEKRWKLYKRQFHSTPHLFKKKKLKSYRVGISTSGRSPRTTGWRSLMKALTVLSRKGREPDRTTAAWMSFVTFINVRTFPKKREKNTCFYNKILYNMIEVFDFWTLKYGIVP